MSDLVLNEATAEKPAKPKKFRINSQQLFLTFPQCPLEPTVVLDKIYSKVNVDKYVVAQEQHKDGNKHIHVYLLLEQKVNIKDANKFDITIDGTVYHPNIQGCRSWKNVVKYVTKDGNYTTNFEKNIIDELIKNSKKVGELYMESRSIAIGEKDVNKALEVLEHPKTARDLLIHGAAIKRNLQLLAAEDDVPEFTIEDYDLDFEWDRRKTLLLWGPTNVGKTSLALALLPKALFVRHVDVLKELDYPHKHDGIIFDDMSFKHWPADPQKHITDTSHRSDINVKHAHVKIPKGCPRIVTSNNIPGDVFNILDPAIERRIQVKNITRCLKRGREVVEEEVDLPPIHNHGYPEWCNNRAKKWREMGWGEEGNVDAEKEGNVGTLNPQDAGDGFPK